MAEREAGLVVLDGVPEAADGLGMKALGAALQGLEQALRLLEEGAGAPAAGQLEEPALAEAQHQLRRLATFAQQVLGLPAVQLSFLQSAAASLEAGAPVQRDTFDRAVALLASSSRARSQSAMDVSAGEPISKFSHPRWLRHRASTRR